jgi:hypothetical protein
VSRWLTLIPLVVLAALAVLAGLSSENLSIGQTPLSGSVFPRPSFPFFRVMLQARKMST